MFPLKVKSCQTLSSPLVLLYRPSKETEIHISILFTGSLLQNSSLFYINLQQYSPVSTDRAVIRTIYYSSNRHNSATTRKAKLFADKNVLIQTLFKLNPESCPQSNVPALLQNKLNYNSNSKCFQLKYFWNNIFKLNPLNFSFVCLLFKNMA